ncbi:Kel3p [Sporobolomyces salmoneus]|uniref:Kel3p n=1 Tax=Sporobolomyces salmoneus TaxID=183962 RepID=UPI00316D482A
MGKVKKQKKEKDNKAEAKAAKKAKAEKKAGKKGSKQAKKGKDDGDMDEDDLIRTLEEYRQAWADEHKVTEETIGGPPSRRANAVLTPSPVSDHLYLFGGEYYDGQTVELYADLYRYDPGKNEWRRFTSPTQPGPRSAHQMVATPAGGGKIWIFGGEFSAPNQSSFHHYRDLWSFDIPTSTWERWDTKLRPSARSGHRMCVWKNYIFLFGGFQDTGIRTSYLNDLWCWSLTDYRWHQIEMKEVDRKPLARSGFSFLPTPDGIALYGGYTKKYEGKKVEGIALNDNWLLKIPPISEDGSMDFTKFKWEKRKNPGYHPSPTRSGCTMAFWAARNMGVLFGGVSDTDPDEETLESVFYNELFGYNTAGNGRWISLPLKKKKKAGGGNKKKKAKQAALAAAQAAEAEARRREEAGEASEDEDERMQRESEEKGSDDDEGDEGEDDDDGPKPWELAKLKKEEEIAQMEEDDPNDPEKSLPGPRYNAMLAVQRNTLYIYGGILEAGDREYTLDDFFTLDLTKLDRYHCLKECIIETAEWHGSDSENDSSDSEDEDGSQAGRSDGEEDEEMEGEDGRAPSVEPIEVEKELEQLKLSDAEIAAIEAEKARIEREELDKKARAFMGVSSATDRTAEDQMSTPEVGETLAIFYARTKTYWAQKAHETIAAGNRGKELRKSGFEIAQQRYEEYRPMLERIQAIQEQAGLDAAEAKATARAGLGSESRNRR